MHPYRSQNFEFVGAFANAERIGHHTKGRNLLGSIQSPTLHMTKIYAHIKSS
jgi:hypothetical protein